MENHIHNQNQNHDIKFKQLDCLKIINWKK